MPILGKRSRKEAFGSDGSHDLSNKHVSRQADSESNNVIDNVRSSEQERLPEENLVNPLSPNSSHFSSATPVLRDGNRLTCPVEVPSPQDTHKNPDQNGTSNEPFTQDMSGFLQGSWAELDLDYVLSSAQNPYPHDEFNDRDLSVTNVDGTCGPKTHQELSFVNDQPPDIPIISDSSLSPMLHSHKRKRLAVDSLKMMLRQPHVDVGCTDVLFARFSRQTCGILSVKDGPTENGWRTLVLPMAINNPPLYHALAALTSFHQVKQSPFLRYQGLVHFNASLAGLLDKSTTLTTDAAAATFLVLAFADSWDKEIATGIDYIQKANSYLQTALSRHKKSPVHGHELQRLRFLCSTWVYMDVIARLTSASSADNTNFDEICQDFVFSCSVTPRAFPNCSPNMSSHNFTGVDTLMGCAASLFPIIRHTARLVRRVWRAPCNNAPIIATAIELRQQLEAWVPPPAAVYAPPEDQHASIEDCLNTANAYRWTTLLHLFQAVPEVANRSSALLANKTLNLLAMVPCTGRAIIVHIYPLLVAGCEMVSQEMRDWVLDRWRFMDRKMGIGVIEASQRVVEEVWRRRDVYEQERQWTGDESMPMLNRDEAAAAQQVAEFFDLAGWEMDQGVSSCGRKMIGIMDFEYTVKGSLHWLGVMKGWNWEVLLG